MNPSDAPSWIDIDSSLQSFGGLEGYETYMKRRELRSKLDNELRGPQFKP